MEFEFISPPLSPVLGYKMSKLSGNPFVSHGRIQDTMTYDILAIGVKWGSVPPPSFYFSLRTGSLEEDSGWGKEEGGRRGGGRSGSGNWVSFYWILDGNKVKIRHPGSGMGKYQDPG